MALTTKQKWWLGGGGTVLGLAILYFARQAQKTYNSVYTVSGIVVKNVALNNISFTILLKVENKGGLNIDVVCQNYSVYINNMFVANIQHPDPTEVAACKKLGTTAEIDACKAKLVTHIPHDSSATVPINVQFNPQDLLKAGLQNMSAIVGNQKNVNIAIKGALTFYAGPVKMTDFPFEENLNLADVLKNSLQVNS